MTKKYSTTPDKLSTLDLHANQLAQIATALDFSRGKSRHSTFTLKPCKYTEILKLKTYFQKSLSFFLNLPKTELWIAAFLLQA